MLGIMRQYKNSVVIKIVFGVIVLSFIGTIFLVWGRGSDQLTSSSYAVKVDGTSIPYEQYAQTYDRLRNIYRQIYGPAFTPEIEKQMGLKKAALDEVVREALVRKAAKKMGLKVTDEELKASIAAVPAFQKDGVFDYQLYQQALRGAKMTPEAFEEAQKEDLLVKKAQQKIMDQAKVSDDEALQAYKKQNDKIDLAYAAFSPADVKREVKLTTQDLQAYLQAHADEFKTPEAVKVAYIQIDPAKAEGRFSVTDDEIQTFYQKHIDRYQGDNGFLPLAEVKDKVKADALADKAAKAAYERAADAVNKNYKTGDIKAAASYLKAQVSETPLFSAANPPAAFAGEPDLAKKALSLKEGELANPVETPKGIYILKAIQKKPAAVPPLEQIKAQVEQKALAAKAQELAKKKAIDAAALLAKNPAAIPLPGDTGSFGYNPAGDIPRIGKSPDGIEAAFKLTTAAPVAPAPIKVGDTWYVIKLKNRIEASKDEFQKTKEQIKKQLLPKKQQEAVEAWIKELKANAKIVKNPALNVEG